MKKLIIICGLLGTHFSNLAQEQVAIKDTQVSISTIGTEQIRLQLIFDLPDGYEHAQASFGRINDGHISPSLVLRSKIEFSIIRLPAVLTPSNKGIGFRVDVDKEMIDNLFNGKYDYHFENETDLNILQRRIDNPLDTTRLKLTIDQMVKQTKNKLTLEAGQKTELVESLKGNIDRTENNIDFGIIPISESDTEKTEYYTSFVYQKGYSFLDNSPVFFSAKGLLSTNSSDSLNFLSIYPISYKFASYDKSGKPKNYDLVAQVGIDANQTFANYRVSINAYWQGVFPNLVDLTMGENRLRLKPVIKAGAKFYKEYENNRLIETENENSNQFFAELYYYIPIQKIYSLIIDVNTFYDFSDKLNPDKEIKYNVSALFGIDIPGTKFKTILKYVKGENGITYQKDELLMIGLMADLFQAK